MAFAAGQHDQQRVQIFRLADALARQHLHQFFTLLGFPVVVIDFGVNVAGADRVDVDAELAPLQRHGAGHLHHRRLAHAVHANLRQHAQARHGCDVDDAPAGIGSGRRPLGTDQHALADFLCDKKCALHIGVENVVIVFFSHILDALRRAHTGVIHKYVDGAHFGFGMGHGRLDAGVVGHIK